MFLFTLNPQLSDQENCENCCYLRRIKGDSQAEHLLEVKRFRLHSKYKESFPFFFSFI